MSWKYLIINLKIENNEVMGLMQGRCDKETFIIYDVIYLNAEASEVNVTLSKYPFIKF